MDIIKEKEEIIDFYEINSKLVLSTFRNGKEETFTTTIRDFDDNNLFVDAISTKNKKHPFDPEESICISAAKLGAIWIGETSVKRFTKSPFEGYWIKFPNKIMKVQRRQFIRLDVMTEVTLKCFKGGHFYTNEYVSSFDISGSGIGIISEEEINKKLDIHAEFVFRGLHIATPIEIIYSKWDEKAQLYYSGARFLGLSKEETDALHKMIIKEEIDRKRSELI